MEVFPLPDELRFCGSLIGQALGDALGFAVEGWLPDDCRAYVDGILRSGRAGEAGRPPFAFGQYTDDTQLARELLASLVACRRFDAAEYAGRIASIFYEKRIVGWGRSTAQAARRLLQGVPWEEAGTPPPAAGNGSAMRAGPIGLLFFDDPARLVAAACDQGRITHQDRRCSAGAVAIAGAVALALQAETIEPEPFLQRLRSWVLQRDEGLATLLVDLIHWVKLPPEEAASPISGAGLDPAFEDRWHGISPFVVPSVLWSLYSFLRTPDDYWETICTAIAVGGDVDTTAAMAGAISGAFLGLKAVPQELAHRLNDRGGWGHDELCALARQAWRLKAGGGI